MVTYDLNKAGQNYDGLITAIKKFPNNHFLKSAWFIKSDASASDISAVLLKHIDKNDQLIVAEINQNRQGWLNQSVWDFLNS